MKKRKFQGFYCEECEAICDSDEEHIFCNHLVVEHALATKHFKWITVSVSGTKPIKAQGKVYPPLRKIHKDLNNLKEND